MPTAQLDRWKAVADAIGEWYRLNDQSVTVDDLDQRFFAWLDPVQRQIAARLLRTYMRIMPLSESEVIDTEMTYNTVTDQTTNTYIGAAAQWSIDHGGQIERIKMKTGRSETAATEAAVLIEGEIETDVTFTEVNAHLGTVETLDVDDDERKKLIGELFAIPESLADRRGTTPGLHCYICPRPARCGQYPALDRSLEGAESRAVVIWKKWLTRMPRCERQVAWARLYGIPTDDGDDEHEGPTAIGISFHAGIAAALKADDPDAAFEAYVVAAPAADQSDLRQLWANLRTLQASEEHPVDVLETEYGVGVTIHAPGIYIDSRDIEHADRLVAVVMNGFADATGREADGTAAIIEYRTGASSSLPLEPEMYALGAHLLTGKSPIAVHTHRIGNADNLECERILFDEERLGMAHETLAEVAQRVASWHPHDALSAPYRIGDHCNWCEFSARCASFRDDSVPSG